MIGIGGIVLQVGRMSRGVGHEVWRKLWVAKSSATTKRLLGLLLEEGDEVCEGIISWMSCAAGQKIIDLPLRSLAFLRPPKAILVPGWKWALALRLLLSMCCINTYNVLLGVLEVLELCMY